jgi:hypothetical protein
MSTPQQRSRDLLTEQGFLVATVEARKSFPDNKKSACRACGHQPQIDYLTDLFGFADIFAIHPETKEIALVQVTTNTHHATRRNKILSSFEAKLVLLAGGEIWIHSWRKDSKLNRWIVRGEEITLKDFEQAPHYPNTVRELTEIRRKEKKPDLPPGADLPFSPILDNDLPF